MFDSDRREAMVDELAASSDEWDIVVVGGGITGAAVLREAVRRGLRAVLVEREDFAAGTSSCSSKLVHGGLRYLRQGNWRLTRDSVRERAGLLHAAPGLVDPLGFVLPVYRNRGPASLLTRAGLWLYDAMGGEHSSRGLSAEELFRLVPHAREASLKGGLYFRDAVTDDARLVLRLLQESRAAGARALNYAAAEGFEVDGDRIRAVRVVDRMGGRELELPARIVVNATGAWAGEVGSQLGVGLPIRPQRGSHLVLPFWRLPVAQAVSFAHPRDRRMVFAIPWQGRTVFGTTDVTHTEGLGEAPAMTAAEADYLMEALAYQFPGLDCGLDDVLASWAGVRAIVGSDDEAPSAASREHALRLDRGLLTVTGGKLTTFRLIARQVLAAARDELPGMKTGDEDMPAFTPTELPDDRPGLGPWARRRLAGRYGSAAQRMLGQDEALWRALEPTDYLGVELTWVAEKEAVAHLDDLMLRRTRLGLLLPDGGMEWLPRVRELCQDALGWHDRRWDREVEAYRRLWQRYHAPRPWRASDA